MPEAACRHRTGAVLAMPDTLPHSPYLGRPLRSEAQFEAINSLTRREMSVLRKIRNARGLGSVTLNICEIETGYSPATLNALLGSLHAKGMIDTWQGDSGLCVKMQPTGFLAVNPMVNTTVGYDAWANVVDLDERRDFAKWGG